MIQEFILELILGVVKGVSNFLWKMISLFFPNGGVAMDAMEEENDHLAMESDSKGNGEPENEFSQSKIDTRKRFANVEFWKGNRTERLSPDISIPINTVICIRLDIGQLSPYSAVIDAEPIPDHLLPKDIWLDVMVSSTDFKVSRSPNNLGESNIADGKFFLPGNGSAATNPEGGKYIYFYLQAPGEAQLARARIGYYYKNHLIQSQLLVTNIGDDASNYEVNTDYTLSNNLRNIDDLPSRNQVSILTNTNGNGRHQIIIRAADEKDKLLAEPKSFEVDEDKINTVVEQLRIKLRREPIAPNRKQRRKDQLKNDLQTLAPLGWGLWDVAVPEEHAIELQMALKTQNDLVIQVTRPESSSYAFPWGLIYDIPIISDSKLEYCPLVENWDGKSKLIQNNDRKCPEEKHHKKTNFLCPFGFWGYRYAIEQLTSTDKAVREISLSSIVQMGVAKTQYEVDEKKLDEHIEVLKEQLNSKFPNGNELVIKSSRDDVLELLANDYPIFYFYCHGERPRPGDPNTYLGVGKKEKIEPKDFKGMVLSYLGSKKVWGKIRPLIFINACHSAEINPTTLTNYLEAFIGMGNAAGVIGTEVRVNQSLAMDVATNFFEYFLAGKTVDQALHAIRTDFLASGNVFGLVYTPYCWSDLKLG